MKDYVMIVQETRYLNANKVVGFAKTSVSNKHKFLTLGIQLGAWRIRDPNKSKRAKNLQATDFGLATWSCLFERFTFDHHCGWLV